MHLLKPKTYFDQSTHLFCLGVANIFIFVFIFDVVIVVMIGQHRGSGDERESLSYHINNPEVSHVFKFYFFP